MGSRPRARPRGGRDVLASRVFAARYLGDSKALGVLRPRLERLLGPLDGLGIRDGASATFVGGLGCMRAAVVRLDLASLRPFVGLAAESVAGDIEIEPPPGGVAVVENFAVFEACCRGEVSGLKDTLVVWAAGYPGRAVKAVIQAASRTRAAVRIWADLDLDGVRIVRLVAEWFSGGVQPFGIFLRARLERFIPGERAGPLHAAHLDLRDVAGARGRCASPSPAQSPVGRRHPCGPRGAAGGAAGRHAPRPARVRLLGRAGGVSRGDREGRGRPP